MTQDLFAPRKLGPIDIEVPAIAIGCAPLGDMPETFAYGVTEEDAKATVRTTLASEIPWLDTAAHYGDGESERRIGLVLRELGGLPSGTFLDTKVGADYNDDYSGETVKRRFERSLSLLGLERIELVFLHDPERTTFEAAFAPGGPIEVLQDFQRQGLIGHLGVAGGPIPMSMQYMETGVFEAAITHNRYSLINRSADPMLDLAQEKGIALLNAAPYGSGILAKGPSNYPRYAYGQAPASTLELAFAYEAICNRYNVPVAAAALQFSLRDPRITSTIVGMSKPERIAQTLDLARFPISEECWAELLAQPFETGDPQGN